MAEEYFGQARELFAKACDIADALRGSPGTKTWSVNLGDFSVVDDEVGRFKVYELAYVQAHIARTGEHPVLSRDPHANDLSRWFIDCEPGEVIARSVTVKKQLCPVYNFQVTKAAQEHLERVRELVRKPSMDMDDR